MLDVRHQQLLMLLFVLQAQPHYGFELCNALGLHCVDQPAHGLVDRSAIRIDFLNRGPRKRPALIPGYSAANTFIIGVENLSVSLITRNIARQELTQYKLFEKP